MLKQEDINSYKNDLQTKPQPYITVNSKQIIDLNVNYKTIKLLEDNIGENLHDLELGRVFLHNTPKP